VRLRWRLRADAIEYRCDVPAGYRVDVENQSGKRLVTA
jgi:hypothetical protein